MAPGAHQKLAREVCAEAGWHVDLVAARWKILALSKSLYCLHEEQAQVITNSLGDQMGSGEKNKLLPTAFCECWHGESLHYIFIFLFLFFIFVFVHLFWICATKEGVSEGYSGVFLPDRYQCSLSFRIWKLENQGRDLKQLVRKPDC